MTIRSTRADARSFRKTHNSMTATKRALKIGLLGALSVSTALCGMVGVSAETLEEALAAAYSTNPQLEAQRAALRATDENVRRAKSNYLPQATANFSKTESEQRNLAFRDGQQILTGNDGEPLPQSSFEFQERPQEFYNFTVNQNLFRGLRTHNEIEQAKAQVSAGRSQLDQVEQQVLLTAVTAYMDVVRDTAVTQLNENNVQVLERQLQASRDRFRVGEITRTDVAQSEARLEGARALLQSSQAQLAASRATYERVVGRTPAGLENEPTRAALPASLQDAIELAIEQSPDVDLARHNERAAQKGIHVAEGALAPTVSLQGQISHFEGRNFFGTIQQDNQSDTRSIVLNVSMPLYLGGSNYSDIRRAKQVRSQRILQIRQAERVVHESVLTAWNQHKAAEAQILSRAAAVRANEIALDGVRQEAQVGSRTTLDVLDAEQELLDSRVNLVTAQRDEIVAAYSLLSSMGQLTARKLSLGVELYNPDQHYKSVKNKLIGW